MKLLETVLLVLLTVGVHANDGHSWEIDCSNPTDLGMTKLKELECNILKDIWDNVNGSHWVDNTNWGQPVYAGEWYGITMWEDNSSIRKFRPGLKVLSNGTQDNNLTGTFPDSIGNFVHLEKFNVTHQKHLSSPIPPYALKNLDSLSTIFFENNNHTGGLPKKLPQGIRNVWIWKLSNLDQPTIPASYADLTELRQLDLVGITGLHGPLPDLSGMKYLEELWIVGNAFTFSDLEPQAVYLEKIKAIKYDVQADINETGHKVYFDKTLRIEPRLAYNPSGHDYYKWHHFTGRDNFTVSYTHGERILLHPNATTEDAGWYCYDVNNSVLTLPCGIGSKFRCLVLHSTCRGTGVDGIHAIHDNAPKVADKQPLTSVTEEEQYIYSSKISDMDSDDTLSVTTNTLPSWLSLSFDQTEFTLLGTPPIGANGDYDINITVTDAKIPVLINYTLHVNPSNNSLPDWLTAEEGGYRHTTSKNHMQGGGLVLKEAYVVLSEPCSDSKHAFALLESEGTLTTGYQTCHDSQSKILTFKEPLQQQAKASIGSDHIFITFPLQEDLSLGEK